MSTSKEDRNSPNYRPRDAKGHYVKSGKANAGNKAKPSARNGKKTVKVRRTPSNGESSKTNTHDSILGILSRVFGPGVRYVEIVETETETESPESQHDTVPDRIATARERRNDTVQRLIAAAKERRIDALLKDNESLRSDLGRLTTDLLDEKSRNRVLTDRIEHALRDVDYYKDNAPIRTVPIAIASAISFIAGCLTAAVAIACR